ncbi:MAG: hypothetical protein ACRETM_04455 [Stenotrophobium sp.]
MTGAKQHQLQYPHAAAAAWHRVAAAFYADADGIILTEAPAHS